MALYRVVPGSFLVTPVKAAYATGEEVELKIKCQLQRKNGIGAWGTWSSQYKIYDKKNTPLATETRMHTMAPWTDIDTATDEFTKKIGTFTPGLLEGYVVATAFG